MTPSQLREEASRHLVDAQIALHDGSYAAAAQHALDAWSLAQCLAHPPRPQEVLNAEADERLRRLLEGTEPKHGGRD